MGKTLVGRDNIEQFICQKDKKLYVAQAMIISPGAKDYLREKGVSVVYGQRQESASKPAPSSEVGSVPNLNRTIQTILKRDYDITDSAKIMEVTKKVLARLDSGQ